MNLTRQTFRNLLCLFLSLIFCIGMLSACSKKPDPLAKTGISSVTLDKKERVCVEVAIMALDGDMIPYGEEIIAVGGTGRGACKTTGGGKG